MANEIEINLGSANGPKVVVHGEHTLDEIQAALPAGWTVHENDWSNGVKTSSGGWAYPLTIEKRDFIPTHEISFTAANGSKMITVVHLDDGRAYTREEWDAAESSDWTVSDGGEWLCQGHATPGGAVGTVTVRRLADRTGVL
jgi:hypothetical protein